MEKNAYLIVIVIKIIFKYYNMRDNNFLLLINKITNKQNCICNVEETCDVFLDGIDILIDYSQQLKQHVSDEEKFTGVLTEIRNFVLQYKFKNKLVFSGSYYWNLELHNSTTTNSNIELNYNILDTNAAYQQLLFSSLPSVNNFYEELIDNKIKIEAILKRLFYRKCAFQNIKTITQCYFN